MTEVRVFQKVGAGRATGQVIGRVAVGLALIANLGACAMASLNSEAQAVGVLQTIEEVDHCRKLSEVNVKTVRRILLIPRNATTVAVELERLARNEAARFDGNTVVPLSPVSDEGRRRYGNYLCPLD